MKTAQFTPEEIHTLYFACLDKLNTLETLLDDKPILSESIQSEINCLYTLKNKLAYASDS
jgi:hypothetical protein